MIFVCDVILLFPTSFCLALLGACDEWPSVSEKFTKTRKRPENKTPAETWKKRFTDSPSGAPAASLGVWQENSLCSKVLELDTFGELRFDRMYLSFKTSDQTQSFLTQVVLRKKTKLFRWRFPWWSLVWKTVYSYSRNSDGKISINLEL